MSVDLQHFDPATILDETTRAVVLALLNHVEELRVELAASQAENARLTAEIYRLKGEHPPRPRGGRGGGDAASGTKPPPDHSSEEPRQERQPRKKSRKTDRVVGDRQQSLSLDRTGLPADLEYKGIVRTVVQELVVRRENIEFFREKWYSPSTGRTYLAPLPPGFRGAFGPGLRHFALELAYDAHVTFPKIHTLLTHHGIFISRGKVSSLLTAELDALHAEAAEVIDAGLASSPWQQFDITSTPVGSEGQACHLLSNPLYTGFRTTPRQDREAVLETLWGSRAPRYRVDATVLARLEAQGVGPQIRRQLEQMLADTDREAAAFQAALRDRLPRLGQETFAKVREAAGIAAYQAATDGPVVRCLHGDDAAAFRELTSQLSLCWIHDARHYQKLQPGFAFFQTQVEAFQARYWEFYGKLKEYRQTPTAARAQELEAEFDPLFATEVSYQPLARCLARTRANKEKLLLVLRHPELPLHNNEAELAARRRVIKRRVSHGPKTAAGAKAWDTLQTLAATSAKLGISFAQFLADRIGERGVIPPLADVIRERAAELKLSGSWKAG